jgi:glutamate dehydrogenase/leucine dehydrogenase
MTAIDWDWDDHGEHMTAELAPHITARVDITPDDFGVDVDDTIYTADEISDMAAYVMHLTVSLDGRPFHDDALGGVLLSWSATGRENQLYLEQTALDMLAEVPSADALAVLMLGYAS